MKAWLRSVYYTLVRLRLLVVGERRATWKKLRKQGRIEVGVGHYGIPIIKHYIHDETRLLVGNYSALSETAIVMLGGQHDASHVTTYPLRIMLKLPGAGQDGVPVHTADTRIGSDVWLAQRAFVRSGITIGHGAIIAAGAVLTKDVPPFAIMGGNPAKVIRYRHTEEQREALLEIRWWDWPEAEIRRATPLLATDDVDAFIDYARRRFPDGPTGAVADVPAPADPFS